MGLTDTVAILTAQSSLFQMLYLHGAQTKADVI